MYCIHYKFLREAFRNLRQLETVNKIKPQIAAMSAPMERPDKVMFNVGQMCSSKDHKWAGVILGWDQTPVKEPGHNASFNPLDVAIYKNQPFYYVVCTHPESSRRLRCACQCIRMLVKGTQR